MYQPNDEYEIFVNLNSKPSPKWYDYEGAENE